MNLVLFYSQICFLNSQLTGMHEKFVQALDMIFLNDIDNDKDRSNNLGKCVATMRNYALFFLWNLLKSPTFKGQTCVERIRSVLYQRV